MRLLILLVTALLPSCLLAEESSPPRKAVGPWLVGPTFNDGKLRYCFSWRPAEIMRPGGFNAIGSGPDGNFYINLETPAWALPAGARYPLKIAAGSVARELTGAAITPKALSVVIGSDSEFLGALRAANALDVTGAAASFRADFTGVGPAMDAVLACLRDNTPASTNPFAPPAKPTITQPVPSQSRSLRTKPTSDQVKAIFAPGFPDFVPDLLDDPAMAKNPQVIGYAGLAFTQIGGLIVFKEEPRETKSEDALIEPIMRESRSKCPAPAVTEGRREEVNGLVFRRISLSCPDKTWGDLLLAIGADRSQMIALFGSADKRAEIEKRAGSIFDRYVASYR